MDDLEVPFGDVTVASPTDETITVTNSGTTDLVIGAITQPAAPFGLLNEACSSQTLAPAANCTLTVRFDPTATGAFADSFDIPSNDPTHAISTINIRGNGTLLLVPKISVTDSVDPATDLAPPTPRL